MQAAELADGVGYRDVRSMRLVMRAKALYHLSWQVETDEQLDAVHFEMAEVLSECLYEYGVCVLMVYQRHDGMWNTFPV